MDSTPDTKDLKARLEAQRERVRGTVDRMVAYLAEAEPQNSLEAFRILRGAEVADRILVRVYTPTDDIMARDIRVAESRAARPAARDASATHKAGRTDDDADMPAMDDLNGWIAVFERKVLDMVKTHRRKNPKFDDYCARWQAHYGVTELAVGGIGQWTPQGGDAEPKGDASDAEVVSDVNDNPPPYCDVKTSGGLLIRLVAFEEQAACEISAPDKGASSDPGPRIRPLHDTGPP